MCWEPFEGRSRKKKWNCTSLEAVLVIWKKGRFSLLNSLSQECKIYLNWRKRNKSILWSVCETQVVVHSFTHSSVFAGLPIKNMWTRLSDKSSRRPLRRRPERQFTAHLLSVGSTRGRVNWDGWRAGLNGAQVAANCFKRRRMCHRGDAECGRGYFRHPQEVL